MRMSGIAALMALALGPGLAAAGEDVVKLPSRIQTLQRPCEELSIARELTLPRLRGSFAELNGQIETQVRLLVDYDAVDARILGDDTGCEGDWEFAISVTSECRATLVSPDVVSIRCSTDFGMGHVLEQQSINFIRSGLRFIPVEAAAFFPDEAAEDDFFQLVAAAVLFQMNGSDDGDPHETIEGTLIESIGFSPAGLLVSISHDSFGTWVPEVTIPLERALHLLEPKLVAMISRASDDHQHGGSR
jgi:hypothetical protein